MGVAEKTTKRKRQKKDRCNPCKFNACDILNTKTESSLWETVSTRKQKPTARFTQTASSIVAQQKVTTAFGRTVSPPKPTSRLPKVASDVATVQRVSTTFSESVSTPKQTPRRSSKLSQVATNVVNRITPTSARRVSTAKPRTSLSISTKKTVRFSQDNSSIPTGTTLPKATTPFNERVYVPKPTSGPFNERVYVPKTQS